MDAAVTVARVDEKATSKGAIYLIFDDAGREFSTFKLDLARAAKQLVGQHASIAYTEKANGQYVNRYLEAIYPSSPPTATNINHNPGPEREAVGGDDTQSRIERQSAIKAAIDALEYLGEAPTVSGVFDIADSFARYYRSGERPASHPRQPLYGQQQIDTSKSTLDDDIPF